MDASSKIAVAGATGRLGRHLVAVLTERGHDVVPMSRANGVDVVTGEGLESALTGVASVVDAATGPSPEQDEATEFFTAAATNLQTIGARTGVQEILAISIVGTDKFTGGYGAAKQVHENLTLNGPVPGRVVRATQFHSFVSQLVEWGTQGDVAYVQNMQMQPVDARALAEVVADVLTERTTPSIIEVAGPRAERLPEIARMLVAHRGDSLRIEDVPAADDVYRDVADKGGLLPGPDAILTGPTFAEWLARADSEHAVLS